jgi:hypothetical protein
MSVVMGWIPYLSSHCYGHGGSYNYVPSWPVLKTDATQNPQRGNIYLYQGDPGHKKGWAPFPGSRVRRASDGTMSAHAQS